MARVRYFGDIIGETSVYSKFGGMLDIMMVCLYRALVDELIRDIVDHANYTW